MPGGSRLPFPDIAASKGYVTRILLAAVFVGSSRRKKREKQKLAPN
jgi:hypothetical protein